MRLRHCRLQQVRLHRDLSLDFAPGLTLIGGPNESGKSTLIDALHRALFLRATVTGTVAEALRSRTHGGHPTIELAFSQGAQEWTLRKCFSGGNATVQLSAQGESALSGQAAEERLAQLLGVDTMLGGKQAGSLPARWAHLWVMQGRAGEDVLEGDPQHYEGERLIEALEARGGATVMQSPRDLAVMEALERTLLENLTPKGRPKANAPLRRAMEAKEQAEAQLQEARHQLDAFNAASDELREAEAQLARLSEAALPAQRDEQARIQRAQAEAQRLDHQIALQQATLQPLIQRHEQLERDRQQLAEWDAQLRTQGEALTRLERRRAEAAANMQPLRLQLEQQRNDHQALADVLAQQEPQLRLVQRLAEQARRRDDRERTANNLAQLQQQRARLSELEHQLATLPAADQHAVAQLRALDGGLRERRAQLAAMAAGVELLQADQPVRIDDVPLTPGVQRDCTEAFTLAVGDGVRVRITPGGGEALAAVQRSLAEQEAAWREALAAAGVADLAQAEQVAQTRQQALAERDSLVALTSGSDSEHREQQLVERLADLDRRLADLAPELTALQTVRDLMRESAPLPETIQELEALQQQRELGLDQTRERLRQAEAALAQTQHQLEALERADHNDANQQPRLEMEITSLQQQRDQRLADHGDAAGLAAALTDLAQRRQQADAVIAQLQASHHALGLPEHPTQRLEDLEQSIRQLTAQIGDLQQRRGALQQHCNTISETDPHARLEQAEARLEQASEDAAERNRLIAAQQRLKALFTDAQQTLAERYTQPLAEAIGDYLKPLLVTDGAPGSACGLDYDSQGRLSGLRLRRGVEQYRVAELSGGMREQLMAALRLSMADVLKDHHDGCLPLVFDDAFTNSDPARVDMVKQMLTVAVERGLQVILLTCDPNPYAGFAEHTIRLPAS